MGLFLIGNFAVSIVLLSSACILVFTCM